MTKLPRTKRIAATSNHSGVVSPARFAFPWAPANAQMKATTQATTNVANTGFRSALNAAMPKAGGATAKRISSVRRGYFMKMNHYGSPLSGTVSPRSLAPAGCGICCRPK